MLTYEEWNEIRRGNDKNDFIKEAEAVLSSVVLAVDISPYNEENIKEFSHVRVSSILYKSIVSDVINKVNYLLNAIIEKFGGDGEKFVSMYLKGLVEFYKWDEPISRENIIDTVFKLSGLDSILVELCGPNSSTSQMVYDKVTNKMILIMMYLCVE